MRSATVIRPVVQVQGSGAPAGGGTVGAPFPVRLSARFPAGCAWFDGHFPGRPVLPGVALLALVRAAVARVTPPGEGQMVVGFGRVRFREPVLPGQRIAGDLQPGRTPGTVRFSFERQGRRLCEGIARLGPRPPGDHPLLEAWQWR